ncbi:MAG TPA: lipase maturation factor family protein, partial [Candidatus Limnocylindrales bacterium]|nr:lipase maturation factor family protein [Candidatus Limnocylindrales bacterium]
LRALLAPRDGVTRRAGWPEWIRRAVLASMFLLSLVPLFIAVGAPSRWLGPLPRAYDIASPFRTVNQYGLFAVMTKERPEIQIEGSVDGVEWETYEFRYKPGNPGRRPGFVAPHQPRLDWQMWFAALSDFRSEPWFFSFCDKLLQNSPPVLALLRSNPFPDPPPRYLRAVVYRYRFTDERTRRTTGAWWSREALGLYCPVMALEEGRLTPAPAELQRW